MLQLYNNTLIPNFIIADPTRVSILFRQNYDPITGTETVSGTTFDVTAITRELTRDEIQQQNESPGVESNQVLFQKGDRMFSFLPAILDRLDSKVGSPTLTLVTGLGTFSVIQDFLKSGDRVVYIDANGAEATVFVLSSIGSNHPAANQYRLTKDENKASSLPTNITNATIVRIERKFAVNMGDHIVLNGVKFRVTTSDVKYLNNKPFDYVVLAVKLKAAIS